MGNHVSSAHDSVKGKVLIGADKSLGHAVDANSDLWLLLPGGEASPGHVVDPSLSTEGVDNNVHLTRVDVDVDTRFEQKLNSPDSRSHKGVTQMRKHLARLGSIVDVAGNRRLDLLVEGSSRLAIFVELALGSVQIGRVDTV